MSGFVHLRARSAYSLAEGAIKLKALVQHAVDDHMPALGLTDHGNLFGALEFAVTAAKAGVQPILGCTLRVAIGDTGRGGRAAPPTLALFAQTEAGWRHLMALSSQAYLDGDGTGAPHLPLSAVLDHAEGLLAATGGAEGALSALLSRGDEKGAAALLDRLGSAFGDRLYVELQRHGAPGEAAVEAAAIQMADAKGLPLLATNDCFFGPPDMHLAHDALLCIAHSRYVAETDRPHATPAQRFRTAAEMRDVFADLPDACDNAVDFARRIGFMPETAQPILPHFPTQAGRSEAEELRAQAQAGLEGRLAVLTIAGEDRAPYLDRLDFELGVIESMGFPGYFLIVAEFIQWAKERGIPVGPGRGSGAGSVVAWALRITDLDPLRFGLLFERFLNPQRVSMPDFDIDFCQERRDEVIRHVQERYGRERVAQIITFGKLQARAALRDVGRVLQMPFGQVDRICKMVPNNPAKPVTIEEALEQEPRLKAERAQDEAVDLLIGTAIRLEGLYRNASTHAAGVVIGDRPLIELAPLYRDPRSDMPATQFNMKWVEQAGLVKFDFLGLKTLSVLTEAVRLAAEGGAQIDLETLPLDDGKTFAMLAKAETVGVFQMESAGMRDVLRKLKADRFEDLIAVVALYRPGPMENIPSYINRKHGREEPDYLHPVLEPYLRETFGIMIYQEQVMQTAQALAGYSLGGADLLRRAMGKKIQAEMDAQRKTFCEGAEGQGVAADIAAGIFDQVAKFAGYGFNKSHAAAYALVAYQTAWMKANYPIEFLAASMTFDMHNTDRLAMFKGEIERLGARLLPPDINASAADFSVERDAEGAAVRYALGAIRNVGEGAMGAVIAERDKAGPFRTLDAFSERADPQAINKRTIENLAAAGAFDSIDRNRARVHAAAEHIARAAANAAETRAVGQGGLFVGEAGGATLMLKDGPDWPVEQRLARESAAVGFYLSAHPLDAYGEVCRRLGVIRWRDAPAMLASGQAAKGREGGALLRFAGVMGAKRERISQRGARYAFAQFSDQSGQFEVTLFAETLNTARELLESGAPVLLICSAQQEEETIRLTAQSVQALDDAAARKSAGIRVFLRDPAALASLRDVLAKDRRGDGRVELVLDLGPDRPTGAPPEVAIRLNGGWTLGKHVRGAIKQMPGVVDLHDLA